MTGNDNADVPLVKPGAPPGPASPQAVGARLRLMRECAGWTVTQMSKHFRIDRTVLHHWEAGNRRADVNKTIDICDYFGMPLQWVWTGRMSALVNAELVARITRADPDSVLATSADAAPPRLLMPPMKRTARRRSTQT